ncbi:MAG: septum formation initiator family protein [Holosporales bacterium]|jgi:cell division protein FtsB|nr:septum formation initiator family protein [Holosporales bacterium]
MKLQSKFVGVSNRLKLIIKIGSILIAALYFVSQAIGGKNGIMSYIVVKKQVIERKKNLENIKNKEISLERNVHLLSSSFLDMDLLEERCRIILNYAFPNDIIINESGLYSSEM